LQNTELFGENYVTNKISNLYNPSPDIETNQLIHEVNNIKNKNHILITDIVKDNIYNELLDITDIYINLSRIEGFGHVIYECMQKSKYIISPIKSIPDHYIDSYYKLITIKYTLINSNIFPQSIYHKYNSQWIEPDIDDCYEKIYKITMKKHIPNLNIYSKKQLLSILL